VDFESTTSLPGDGIEAFPRSDAITAPFPSPNNSIILINSNTKYIFNSSKKISHKDLIALIFYNNYIYIDLYSESELG
jgi:hypothetical protein